MSTIDRKYAYLDEGTFPEEGDYGTTYLTLKSSEAGNIYDGWIWDPDEKNVSEVERTFGYRNPDNPNYCWDDEVIVDLSNPQNREESEFEQGRITSFNTNVSDVPIILQDAGDISGLTEDQRERMATTVLFSAIPLIKDAYIHAEVEVAMKMNISPDNTTGRVRLEAFYILNDNSDRTMRPHPINHYSVSKPDEYNLLRLLYWNPALRHEDMNYIGVKLLCSGGTAEIGISDDPDYGDAIITLTSAGLTGDTIDTKREPVSLWIQGKQLVPPKYKIKISDYMVFCEFSDGQIFEVSRFCNFYPEIGTEIEVNTVLVAEYLGLSASIRIQIARIESIELTSIPEFYGPFTLDYNKLFVLGYLENGEVVDVTDACNYSPAIGTTISQTTTLTATLTNYDETVVQDTFTMTRKNIVAVGDNGGGLIYTLYEDNVIDITGNAESVVETGGSHGLRETVSIPDSITSLLPSEDVEGIGSRHYCDSLMWSAEGAISGAFFGSTMIKEFIGFKDAIMAPRYFKVEGSSFELSDDNYIDIRFSMQQVHLTSFDLDDLYEGMLFDDDFESGISFKTDGSQLFENCRSLDNVNALSVLVGHFVPTSLYMTFSGCIQLTDLSGITDLDVTRVTTAEGAFRMTENLKSAGALYKWRLSRCRSTEAMFIRSGLTHVQGLGNLNIGKMIERGSGEYDITLASMFSYCDDLEDLLGLQELITGYRDLSHYGPFINLAMMFSNDTKLSNIDAISNWETPNVRSTYAMFSGCSELEDIYATYGWDMTNVKRIDSMCSSTKINGSINPINNWSLDNCTNFIGAFAWSGEWEEDEHGSRIWYTPYIDDASGVLWPDVVSELTVENVAIVVYGSIELNSFVSADDVTYFYPTVSLFGGLDIFTWEGPNVRFVYSSRLPEWYKLIISGAVLDSNNTP